MAEKLTKRAVDRLIAQADPDRDVLVWDAAVPGLLAGREVEALDLSHMQALHRSLAATPTQAKRCMTVISVVIGFAARHPRLRPAGGDPTAGVEPYPERKYRERFSLAQLAQLGEAIREAEAAGSLHRSALLAIRLLALTGMRRSEVTGHMQKVRRTETPAMVNRYAHLT